MLSPSRAVGRLLLGLGMLLVFVLVAAACGDDDEDEVAELAPAATEAPAEEVAAVAEPEVAEPEEEAVVAAVRGTFRDYHQNFWGGSEVIDPASPSWWYPHILILYDRLVVMNQDGVPSTQLSTAWEIDDTLKKWTFDIRQGVTFSDGTPMTSADVAFTMRHVLDPEVGSQAASTLTFVDAEGFETPDDHTFVMNLTEPHVDLPLLMTSITIRVIPEGITREFMERDANGTGPFTIESVSFDGLSEFNPRDDYWGGMPGPGKVTVTMIPESDARTAALLADQIDWARQLAVSQLQQIEGNPNYYVQENGAGSAQLIVPLVTEAPFDDVRVRQALRAALDPEEMVAIATQGHATIACNNPVRPNDQYHLPQDCPQDIELAKALLAEAGYPDGITIEMATSDYTPVWKDIATVYKEQAAAAGITVEIVQVPADGYWSDTWQHHPFSHSQWGRRDADAFLNEAFRCDASWTEGYWCDSSYEALLDAARAEPNFNQRKALYQQAQAMVADVGPIIVPFFQNEIRAMNVRVSGVEEWWYGSEHRHHMIHVEPQ